MLTHERPSARRLTAAPLALGLFACTAAPTHVLLDTGPPADAARPADARPLADAGPAADTNPPALACEQLQRFRGGLLIAPFRARHAAFAPGLNAVALVEYHEDAPGDLVVASLVSREQRTLATHVGRVDWIDDQRMIASVSVFGLRPLPSPRLPGGYNLELHHRDGGEPQLLFAGACGYALAPDRSLLLAVHECIDGRGTLSLRSLAGGDPQEIATDVAHSARFSPDGRRVAFFLGHAPFGCEGELHLYGIDSGTSARIAPAARHARFVPGALVFETCGESSTLRAYHFVGAREVSLGEALDVRWGDACPDRATYAVSPDGTRLLGARISQLDDLTSAFNLESIRIDGRNTDVLAADPLSFPRYEAFAFNSDGTKVLYLRSTYGLGVVPSTGGEPVTISARLSLWQGFARSPGGDAVAYLERRKASSVSVVQTKLATNAARSLYAATSATSLEYPPEYLPDGRGLLWGGGRANQLIYIPSSAGPPRALGYLDREAPLGCLGYVVDPTGCLLLFNDRESTRLVQLPR